jgi:MFS family permease
MRRVLARRDMRLYVGGLTLSMFGDTALWLALAVWAKTLTGSSAAAWMVMFFLAAPQLLAPLWGLVVDRVRRRPLLVVTNLATAVAVLPLLLVHDRGDVWILYAVTLAYGVSFSLLGSAGSALLATMLPTDELADANGILQGRVYSAVEVFVGTPQTISIGLGALLVALVDYRALLLVEAVVVAGAGAWLLTRVPASH